jgi:hypothetical protein
LDYDNIFLRKIQFLPITFDGDVLCELSPIHSNVHNPSQMQGMDKEYNGHAWCKLGTTNIKNLFGLDFKKAHCLGHLQCVQDDYENFVRYVICNETFWSGECIHIPLLSQMTMISSSSLLGCKFCHSPPFCVTDYSGRIYYAMHRLQLMSRTVIHLGVHNHLVVDGKCWELIEETRRLMARLMQKYL